MNIYNACGNQHLSIVRERQTKVKEKLKTLNLSVMNFQIGIVAGTRAYFQQYLNNYHFKYKD